MPKSAVLILPLFLAACSDTSVTAAPDGKTPAKPPAVSAAALPGTVTQPDETSVKGTVLETIDAGPYTYLRLKTSSGEVWAAVNEAKLGVGAEVSVGHALWMANFESKTLNRKFERILFGTLMNEGDVEGLPAGHPPTSASNPGAAAPAADLGDTKVEKAPGKDAKTVAEIWASKAALKGLEVVVRGRVVKFNPEIMGRNWIHLRDGSGSAEKQDNDITVTTTDVVAKGDVVTLRGKVVLDQDFTAGYAYPVMLESARVVK